MLPFTFAILKVSTSSPQIGFNVLNGFYGEGNGPVFSVTCFGIENRLDHCMISSQTSCSHSQDGGAFYGGMLVDKQCT